MCVKIQENYSTEPQKDNQKKNNFWLTHGKRTLIKKKSVRKSPSRHGFLIWWLGLVLARHTLGHLLEELLLVRDQACHRDLQVGQPICSIANCGMLGAGSWDGRITALLARRWLPLTRYPATSTWGWGILDAIVVLQLNDGSCQKPMSINQ